ncbi:MAG: hypothetical protein AAF799_24940 [Myxococcota bacterium]
MSANPDEPVPEAEADAGAEAVSPLPREQLVRLMDAHGAAMYRHCVAVLGRDEADELVPVIFAHVHELGAHDESMGERARLHAMTFNRCIARGRAGGGPALHGVELQGRLEPRVAKAMLQLRPIGRAGLVQRSVLGFPWSELVTVRGTSVSKLVAQTCRAWRRLDHFVVGLPGADAPPMQRPQGKPLSDDPQAWAEIRGDAQRFADVRQALRSLMARVHPADNWQDWIWEAIGDLEQQAVEREEQKVAAKRRAEQRVEEQRAAEAAAAERAKADAEAEAAAGAFAAAVDEDDDRAHDMSDVRGGSRMGRLVAIGVGLVALGVLARWLVLT